jgi:ATP-dependent RNA helicase RhlE
MTNDASSGNGFQNLGIAPKLLEILHNLKFTTPTPIQAKSIPSAIEGKDIMGIAQTGTGKTLAFGIPMIQRLAQNKGGAQGLIILPTRELAVQVNVALRQIGDSIGLRTAILIGGEPIGRQIKSLKHNLHIIIATPGRLIDHMENNNIKLSNVGILVLDEADRMLDMGFAPQIKRIMQQVPKSRQTMLFSATMPNEIVNIAKTFMTLPLRIEVAPAGTATELVSHEVFFVSREDKPALLKNVLTEYKGSVLVFCRTKFGAKKVAKSVRTYGHTATEIHSNRSLNQRFEALDGFKIGRYRVLVATDIAARGIDVTGIEVVLNYDLPATPEDYVHRIGRTGRAGRSGHTISFATPDQKNDIRSIERFIKISLPVSKSLVSREAGSVPERPQFEPQKFSAPRSQSSSSGFHRGNRRSNRRFSHREIRPDKRSPHHGRNRTATEGGGYFLKRYPNKSDE